MYLQKLGRAKKVAEEQSKIRIWIHPRIRIRTKVSRIRNIGGIPNEDTGCTLT
jgi:hypothetical protein